MLDDLSQKAKRLLATQHHKLMHDDSAVAKNSGALVEILDWCAEIEFTPGKWIKPNRTYRFDKDHIARINQILLEDKYASIFDDFSQSNHRSAALINPNEKQGHIKPTHHLILAAVTDPKILDVVCYGFYSQQQVNIELDVRELILDDFDCLIVVENRDSFNDWSEYQSYSNLSNPLVVYRGDKCHSRACKTLFKTWLASQSSKSAIYFGDYDLAGFRIATSAGYTHLLLPEPSWLSQQMIRQHYPDNQQKYLAKLELDCPIGWQPLLQLMRENRAGLRQQKMYDTPLILYSNSGWDKARI